jgi:hypothetical protein
MISDTLALTLKSKAYSNFSCQLNVSTMSSDFWWVYALNAPLPTPPGQYLVTSTEKQSLHNFC